MSKYLASDLLCDQLVAEGTRYVFGKFGATELPIMASLQNRADLHFVQGLTDAIAVYMAMGYAQVSGKIGVACVSGDAGFTNVLSPLYVANISRVPLVIIAGKPDINVNSDVCTLTNSLLGFAYKWSYELKSDDELARVVRRAFHEAYAPPMGPTLVALPVNLLAQSASKRMIMPAKLSPQGGADANFVKRAAQLLLGAAKPAMLVGNEIAQYRARRDVVSLAEVIGCPVFAEDLPSGIAFPNQHPLFAGFVPDCFSKTQEAFDNCDVVLAVGVQNRCRFVGFPDLIPSTTVVVQVNVDPRLAGQVLPCHFVANADLSETLSKVRAEVQLIADNQWVIRAKERARKNESEIARKREAMRKDFSSPEDSSCITLPFLLQSLDALRPQKSVVINDMGRHSHLTIEVMKFEHGSSYCSLQGGVSGYALPASVGAQWANHEYTVISIAGDAAALQHVQSLWTARHYGLGAKIVVLNNQGYSLDHYNKLNASDGVVDIKDPSISFLEIAKSMAVPGRSICKPGELETALKDMFNTQGPYLLEVCLEMAKHNA